MTGIGVRFEGAVERFLKVYEAEADRLVARYGFLGGIGKFQ